MADDQMVPSTSEPEIEEEGQEVGDEENSSSVSNNSSSNRYRNSGEGGTRIGGEDEIERRINMLDKDQESIESRMSFRERTSRQLNRSMLFLSFNLEFIAGIHAYLRIRSRNLGWKARAIRVLPLFLIPALSTLFSSLLCRFTIILNLRDRKSLEKLRKERIAKIQELAQSQFQNYHGESSSVASTSRKNLPESSRSTSGMNFNAHEHLEKPENSKNKLKCLVICTNCRMHNGFASKEVLQFVSYTCSHCKAFNGHETASSSAIHALQSIPYNPPYNENEIEEETLPRGISIEEVTPSQEITDPEMDPPVMIIRESPSVASSREFLHALDQPVMVPEMPRGLLIEEITQNPALVNDPELDPPVIIQESAFTGGEAEGLTDSDEMPRGLLIEEITLNQGINNLELDPPVIFQESPSVGGEGPSTVLDPPVIEELTPNQEIVNHEMDPQVMFVQVSPSVTGEEELLRENSPGQMDLPVNTVTGDVMIPDDDDVTSLTVQELPLETLELLHSSENVTIVSYPDTDADITPVGPVTPTRLTFEDPLTESNEIIRETHNSNNLNNNNNDNDSEDDSTNGWRSVSSGQFAENGVRVTEVQVQEGINEDESLRESRETEGAEMNVTYPDTDFELNCSETDSDYGSVIEDDGRETRQDPLAQSEEPLNQDQLSQEENGFSSEDEYGNAGAGSDEIEESSVRVRDVEEEQNDIFMSVYNDADDDDRDSNGLRSISGDPVNSVADEIHWTGWQQAQETDNPLRVFEGPQTQEHGNPMRVLEMSQTEEPENPIRVSEISAMEEPQVDLSSESSVTCNLDEGKNSVGSFASKSESTATEDPRKGIGGNFKKEDQGSQGESENVELGEVSDKEGSIKKGATEVSEADPVVKATAALLSSNPSPDPKLKPFSGIGSTVGSRWGRSNDFEPAKFDGLRHRRSFTPPLITEPPLLGSEPGNGGSSHPVPPTEIDGMEGPVIGF